MLYQFNLIMKFSLNFCFSVVIFLVIFSPFIVFGGSGTIRTFVLGAVRDLANAFIFLLYAISIVVFLWGLSKFVLKSDEETERTKGKTLMTWGIIALFILGTFNGIVFILSRTFFNVDKSEFLPESGSDFTT